MSKKFGKFLLFSAITGAAIYGAYQYLQKKDEMVSADTHENDDDDFCMLTASIWQLNSGYMKSNN